MRATVDKIFLYTLTCESRQPQYDIPRYMTENVYTVLTNSTNYLIAQLYIAPRILYRDTNLGKRRINPNEYEIIEMQMLHIPELIIP